MPIPPLQPHQQDTIDQDLGERYYKNSKVLEDKCLEEFINVIRAAIDWRFQAGDRPARRDAHAFDTGCVQAFFQVDRQLDPALSKGAFAPGEIYEAWIRFSNGNFFRTSSRALDARGMAIKLMGVSGSKLLDEEKYTQDFILISHPQFFVYDLMNYIKTLQVFLKGGLWNQWILSPMHLRSIRLIWIALCANVALPGNPLLRQYWSMTPYQLGVGEGRLAVKYTAKPRLAKKRNLASRVLDIFRWGFSPKQDMQNLLAGNEMWFDFYVQRYVDERTPIEDATVEWREDVSEPIHVAKIVIPSQQILSQARNQFCENLSFNPWHCLPEHKPLGLINRVRRAVYSAISEHRHALNQIEPKEPTV